MNEAGLKEDWLAGNAVVAFVGALLVAQSWQTSDGTLRLPFNVTSDGRSRRLPARLVARPRPTLRCWAFRITRLWSPILGSWSGSHSP